MSVVCSSDLVRTAFIEVTNLVAVVADFAAAPTQGAVPLTVVFTNLSSGATAYLWQFGDGNSRTNEQPPHSYTQAGLYTVSLTAVGLAGTNELVRTAFIEVTNLVFF